jgi:hypothetical protein
MRYHLIIHPTNGEPIEGEVDEIPGPQATLIALKNPHKRSNRDLDWTDHRVNTLLLTVAHIVSIEVIVTRAEEEIITKPGVDTRG